jgi:hypothetical protein
MRKVTMVRLGIAVAITALGAAGAITSGCTSDDNAAGADGGGGDSGGGSSGGSSSGTGGSSSGTGGSSSGSSSGASSGGVVPANLVILHAAAGLGPFRVCFATQSAGTTASVTPQPAAPDTPGTPGGPSIPPDPLSTDGGGQVAPGTPGIYPGTIGAYQNPGTSLQGLAITPYIINSGAVANDSAPADGGAGSNSVDGGKEEDCQHLIGSHGNGAGDPVPGRLTKGVDFWGLPQIPSGTFKDGHTYLLSITGCVAGFEPSATEQGLAAAATPAVAVSGANICGADYGDGGAPNLAISVNEMDITAPAADAGMGIQFSNESPAMVNNPFFYGLTNGSTLVAVVVHPPAIGGLVPGIPGADVTEEDAGPDAAPVTVVTPNFTPIANPALVGTLTTTQDIPGLPFFLADGGAGPAYFGALTAPGSGDGGSEVLAQYPVYPTGVPTAPVALGDQFALPLSAVFTLSGWSASTAAAPPYFANGQTYTFVFVGSNDVGIPQLVDSTGAPNPAYDGRGMHIVAFPNVYTAKQ